MNFIKLTDTEGATIYINKLHIVSVEEFDKHTQIELINGKSISIEERYISISPHLNN